MNINLTDDRTTVGSYDNRSSGGVLLMPKERHMREGTPIQPHANALLCAKPAGRFRHCVRAPRASRARRPSPPARRALAQHGAATEEKTRDEDDDRRRDERRGRGEDHRGVRRPG